MCNRATAGMVLVPCPAMAPGSGGPELVAHKFVLDSRRGARRQQVQSTADGTDPTITAAMCRNIRVLYNFEPPTTEDEIRAAALQYVRKVSGLAKPSAADLETFERAVAEVAAATRRLLSTLRARTAVRTREHERAKARARGERRAARNAPA